MPSQLKRKLIQEYPFFSSFPSCIDGFFAAIDPPHALRTEAFLLPPLSPNDPKPAPVPSPTQDPRPGETPAQRSLVLMPAGVPTVEQPQTTIMFAPSPNHGEPVAGPHRNDHGPYDVLPPDSIPSVRHPNQGSHPNQGNDPKQDSNSKQTNRNLEQVKDPSKSYLPPEKLSAIKRNGNSDRNTDKTALNDPKQTDKASSFEKDAKQDVPLVNVLKAPTSQDRTKNIAGQAVTFGRDAITVAGTTLSPGASAVTISGTLISFGSSALIIGSSTIPLSQTADALITTVAGHTITAAPNAIEVAGTTLHPGNPGITLDGTAVSLDTAGHLVVGSKTMTVTVESAGLGEQILGAFGDDPASDASDPITTSIGGQVITAAPTGVAFAGTTPDSRVSWEDGWWNGDIFERGWSAGSGCQDHFFH